MEKKIQDLKKAKNYDEIIRLMCEVKPGECNSAKTAHAVGKAYEKKSAFSQSIPWHMRCFELDTSDETLGMVIGVCLAVGNYAKVEEILAKASLLSDGYYYAAGMSELAFRRGEGEEREIETIEAFLNIQNEESYMLRLATLYLRTGREREAKRILKKVNRLFISGKSVDYAKNVMQAISEENALEYIQANPWYDNYVFKHINFDISATAIEDVFIENKKEETKTVAVEPEKKKEKKKEKNKISPIIEKAFDEVVGMQELKIAMNDIFNMMQAAKRRVGYESIIKNNIQIYGPEGCGKTTAALAVAKVMYNLGITVDEEPQCVDYFSLTGGSKEETHENIQNLFENAMGKCILIENVHEFDDEGAYSIGLDAIEQLTRAYYAAEERIPFIITGSQKEVEVLFSKKRKFGELFNLPESVLGKYTVEELVLIADKIAEKKGLTLEESAKDALNAKMEYMYGQPDFKYSQDLETIITKAVIRQGVRLGAKRRVKDENAYYILTADDLVLGEEETAETVEELLNELEGMTGLAGVKTQVRKIVNQAKIQKMRKEEGVQTGQGLGSLHLVFLGNAGTGKTTVARILGKIYKRLGVLPSGQLIECTRQNLVAEHVGGTAVKVAERVKEAMGGILFIDEAYTLCPDDSDSYGREAINSLLTHIENHRDNLMVILAGYSEDMDKFMDKNQGLRSRIPTDILFEDYTTEEMVDIFKYNVRKNHLVLDKELDERIYELIDERKNQKNFGNARGVRNLFEEVCGNMDNRLAEKDVAMLSKNDYLIIRKEDIPVSGGKKENAKTVEDYLYELKRLTGLASVKEEIDKIVATVKVNNAMKAAGLPVQGFGTLHMVFKGNAGTGKTTVARLLGGIYRELGVLSKGHLVECGRSDLVGNYVGQTASITKAKVQEAMGGILFIDEAYTLAKGGENDFGKEAIDTLVADIENYRNNLMVIVAGYSNDMDIFMAQNQGLSSRFPNEIVFEDYTVEEMLSIFKAMIAGKMLIMSDELDECAKRVIAKYAAEADFGNARGIRNLVEKIYKQRTLRIIEQCQMESNPSKEFLQTVIREDLEYFL